MRFANADPPYIGQARRHYGPEAREVNHQLLIAHLEEFDGWALSLSAPSLRVILPMCPDDARVCAWVRTFALFKKNVTQAFAWEPVIVKLIRCCPTDDPTVRDWVSVPITLQRGVSGAKPAGFCNWLFEFAGLTSGDEFVDLFPGSGAVHGVGVRGHHSWRVSDVAR